MDHVSLLQTAVIGVGGLFAPGCAVASIVVLLGDRRRRPLVALHGHSLEAGRTQAAGFRSTLETPVAVTRSTARPTSR
ncbi:MAG TPA: hypothetical protein VME40_01070 [Caulobacteraceae bacterium]|nr:hypothetical protein [Caulobacteraceae bacterium]